MSERSREAGRPEDQAQTGDDLQEGAARGGLRVIVDRSLCIGSADCVAAAPTVFRLDARRRVVLLDPMTVDERTLRRAAERCPTDAIILEDEHGEQIYP
jgi:ferredoxin